MWTKMVALHWHDIITNLAKIPYSRAWAATQNRTVIIRISVLIVEEQRYASSLAASWSLSVVPKSQRRLRTAWSDTPLAMVMWERWTGHRESRAVCTRGEDSTYLHCRHMPQLMAYYGLSSFVQEIDLGKRFPPLRRCHAVSPGARAT